VATIIGRVIHRLALDKLLETQVAPELVAPLAARPDRLELDFVGEEAATALSQTVEADVKHGAKQIVKELAKLFVEQGWIAQEQADKLFWDR
jgi:hypothetical protein